MKKHAFYDALTQLPDRRLLTELLQQAISNNKRSGSYGAVMFLDLDNFKPLNDQHGHFIGDLLLIEVGQRLKHCVRESDAVARLLGGYRHSCDVARFRRWILLLLPTMPAA
ncbi:diguanylate cyclase domain-containing protein [Alishewanella longhuensis]